MGPAAGAAAFVGHLYPVWLSFRGGKGLATFFGILIPLLWPAALIYALVWLVLVAAIRISSVGGIAAAISAPITAVFLHSSLFPMLLGLALLALWKHRENILRLMKGTEPRIGSKTSPTA
jgi:glycerol-3-phosphate acyltransferase PlsY